jgi:hypothetical protein
MLGFGAYADSSRLINDEIRQYKGIKSQAEGLNKELQVQAGQAKTLGDLKNIGEEFGLKTTKDLLKKYGPSVYKAKIPYANTTIQDIDKTAGKGLDEVLEGAKAKGSEAIDSIFNAGKNIPPPLASQSGSQLAYQNRLNADPELEEIQNIRENNLAQRQAGQMYERQIITPDPKEAGKVNIEKQSASAVAEEGEKISSPDLAGGAKDAGEVAGEVGEVAGKEIAEKGAEEVGGQVAVAALGATGVLAPLAGVLEAGLDIWTLFEGAKSIGDIFDREVLGHTASVNAPQAVIPTQPKTLAQKGYSVTPSIDTYDMPHSTVSLGW